MSSRRRFLQAATVTAAAVAAGASATALPQRAAARPTKASPPVTPVKPSPQPSASPHPSPVARALAGSLQNDLPNAHLSDAMTAQIANDIQGNLAIGKAFRKRKGTLPAPDLCFSPVEDTSS